MKLIVTIDTEEDGWSNYRPTGYSLENIKGIPRLQEIFDRYGVKPTYLITYPIATDDYCIDLFSKYHAENKCEIGLHCHPWNTPPFEEEINVYNSMMANLPEDLQFKKLKVLKETIVKNLGVTPLSYRAGRWAFHAGSARALAALGLKVDTSMTAYTDWSEYDGVDYTWVSPEPFRFNPENIFKSEPEGRLLQVPASVGFLQQNFLLANKIYRSLEGSHWKKLRIKGILHRLGLLNQIPLSPELSSAEDMIKLLIKMSKMEFIVANMFFHSTALKKGLSPFVTSEEDEISFLRRVEDFVAFTSTAGVESVTLGQFESVMRAPLIHRTRFAHSSPNLGTE